MNEPRPHPFLLRDNVIDDDGQLRKGFPRRAVTAQARCRRRGHLVAAVVTTPHGQLIVWRDYKPPWTWYAAYVDEAGPFVEAGCRCGYDPDQMPEPRLVESAWLARQRGKVISGQ